MQLNISIIQVEKSTKTSSKGTSYQQLEVTYKNLGDGKVGAKKIMSFDETVYKALADAKNGDTFAVVNEKKGDYWNWTSVSQAAPGSAVANEQGLSTGQQAKQGSYTPRSGFETPEERAAKQVLIVKQSCLNVAVQALVPGAKSPVPGPDILEYAQKLVDWVFAKPTVPQPTLNDMESDIPY